MNLWILKNFLIKSNQIKFNDAQKKLYLNRLNDLKIGKKTSEQKKSDYQS